MVKVNFGRKNEPTYELQPAADLIAVRTRSKRSLQRGSEPVATPERGSLEDGALIAAYPEAGVEVYRVPVAKGRPSLEDRKVALRASPDVRFAGGVLVDPATKEPVLYTENLFVKFADSADSDDCRDVLRNAGLSIKEVVKYASNSFFAAAEEGTGRRVFDIAQQLLGRDDVEYAHPELIRPRARKAIGPQQWHLKRTTVSGAVVDAHVDVEAAHLVTRGEGVTVAVIDDGFDVDHLEFAGTGKVVAPRDATLQTSDPRPKDPWGTGPNDGENHGTACAGVAVANGASGASGVAPQARLMPIRLSSGLGSQREADAFVWAADHGADVISCSWGPADGRWWDPADPRHSQPVALPASTRLALEYVTTRGRGGKGCVVVFAAGNGRESVDNDGYASSAMVIAVAACNDTGRRSVYSDFGRAIWCSFPSSDFAYAPFAQPAPLTPGIWTTDRGGANGYNTGDNGDGDATGRFTATFGGTSSACPGVAGVAALVLAVNPDLKAGEVKQLLQRACDRIDPQGGAYDGNGHSRFYGHGRLNARAAVELAQPQPRDEVTVERRFDAPIPDLQTVNFTLNVVESTPVESVVVGVELLHTYIGDLVITLLPPSASGVGPIVLHNRAGGASDDLKVSYDARTVPALAQLAGKRCHGAWTLRIKDAAHLDSGKLVSFSLRLSLPHADRAVLVPTRARTPVA